jgi:uncharacterized membrane protein YoaK (UPF0700 family)
MTSASSTPRIPASRPWLSRTLIADPRFGPLPGPLLLLTVVTGVVDAISILALGRVFVANMTGNVVFAGFAIAGAPGFSLSASLLALAGFLAGALGGAALTLYTSPVAALTLALSLLGVVAAAAVAAASHPAPWRTPQAQPR